MKSQMNAHVQSSCILRILSLSRSQAASRQGRLFLVLGTLLDLTDSPTIVILYVGGGGGMTRGLHSDYRSTSRI